MTRREARKELHNLLGKEDIVLFKAYAIAILLFQSIGYEDISQILRTILEEQDFKFEIKVIRKDQRISKARMQAQHEIHTLRNQAYETYLRIGRLESTRVDSTEYLAAKALEAFTQLLQCLVH